MGRKKTLFKRLHFTLIPYADVRIFFSPPYTDQLKPAILGY